MGFMARSVPLVIIAGLFALSACGGEESPEPEVEIAASLQTFSSTVAHISPIESVQHREIKAYGGSPICPDCRQDDLDPRSRPPVMFTPPERRIPELPPRLDWLQKK